MADRKRVCIEQVYQPEPGACIGEYFQRERAFVVTEEQAGVVVSLLDGWEAQEELCDHNTIVSGARYADEADFCEEQAQQQIEDAQRRIERATETLRTWADWRRRQR